MLRSYFYQPMTILCPFSFFYFPLQCNDLQANEAINNARKVKENCLMAF